MQDGDDLARGQRAGQVFGDIGRFPERDVVERQRRLDHGFRIIDPEIGVERIAPRRFVLTRAHGPLQSRAKRASGIARRRVDVRIDAEIPDHARIGGAVERDASSKAEIAGAVFAHQRWQNAGNRDLQRFLHRGGEIVMFLAHRLIRPPRHHAEMRDQRRIVMPVMPAEIEEPPVQRERAVLVQLEDRAKQFIAIARPAIGREAHDLVFALIDLEAEILGEDRVEQAERVRKMDRAQFRQPVAFAEMHARGLVFADPIERDHHRALERRGKESRGGVRAVMLGKLDPMVEPHMHPKLAGNRQFVLHEAGQIGVKDAAGARPIVDDLIP